MNGVFRQLLRRYGWFVVKILGASLMMYWTVDAIAALIFIRDYDNTILVGGVAGCIMVGVMSYFGIHLLVSRSELASFWKNYKKKSD